MSPLQGSRQRRGKPPRPLPWPITCRPCRAERTSPSLRNGTGSRSHRLGLLILLLTGLTAHAQSANDSLADREQAAIRAAVERVAESVVQIRTIGGVDTVDGSIRADGPTSGLIISPDGYILSSA